MDAVDSAGRTSCFTFAAERTLVGIDIGEVVGNGDSIVSANGLTLTATDTSVFASFAGNSALGFARARFRQQFQEFHRESCVNIFHGRRTHKCQVLLPGDSDLA